MVSIGTGATRTLTFAATMLVGMALARWIMAASEPSTTES
jgi:hypothetical protein